MAASEISDKLLVVVGATGAQGGAVLRYFAAQPLHLGFKLRGVTRNTESKQSQELQDLGVQMVRADLSDLSSVQQAFAGATHIFANTDSVQYVFDAFSHPEKLKPGQSPIEHAVGIERRMGVNIGDAAASVDSLQQIVWSSLPGIKKISKGRYPNVWFSDSKDDIADVLRANEKISDKLSMLLVGTYADQPINVPEFCAPRKVSRILFEPLMELGIREHLTEKQQEDGVYVLSMPITGDVPFPIADVQSDLGSWVAALFEAGPGTSLVGASERLTWKEWLELWGKQNNVETRFQQIQPEEYFQNTPAFRSTIVDNIHFMEELGMSSVVPKPVYAEDLRGRGITIQTTRIADQMKKCDWSSIL